MSKHKGMTVAQLIAELVLCDQSAIVYVLTPKEMKPLSEITEDSEENTVMLEGE